MPAFHGGLSQPNSCIHDLASVKNRRQQMTAATGEKGNRADTRDKYGRPNGVDRLAQSGTIDKGFSNNQRSVPVPEEALSQPFESKLTRANNSKELGITRSTHMPQVNNTKTATRTFLTIIKNKVQRDPWRGRAELGKSEVT